MTGQLEVTDKQDFYAMLTTMGEVDLQGVDLVTYAQTWVCQKDGFETSSACVLQPFATAMDVLDDAFTTAFGTFFTKWNALRHAAAESLIDFETQEHQTVDDINVLMGVEQDVVLPNGKHLR